MKHVYLINSNSRASQYGIGTYIDQVVNCFKKTNLLRLTIVNLNSESEELNEKNENNIRYLNLPNVIGSIEDITNRRFYRNIVYLLALYVDKNEDNVFHLNYLHHEPLIDLLKEKWSLCEIVLTIHYFSWSFSLKGNITYFKNILTKNEGKRTTDEKVIYADYKLELSLFSKIDKIICLAESTKQLLCHVYQIDERKITLVYNGLCDQAALLSEEEKKQKKIDFCFSEDEKLVLFVGRLDDIKGLSYLIEAFREVLMVIPKVRLLVVGDGNYAKYLQMSTGVWSRITFTGKIGKQQLYELYQIVDVGVMPSFHEQCSYVAIEMMMYGLPLIITSTTGLSEMLDDRNSECRLLLNEGDNTIDLPVVELSSCLLKMITNDTLSKEIGKYNRERYEKTFSLAKMDLALATFYLNESKINK